MAGDMRKKRKKMTDFWTLILLCVIALQQATASARFTVIELRHDCSGSSGLHPIISRDLWTSVVYRLKAPLYQKCQHKLDMIFTWSFQLKEPISCLAMLGCYDLEGDVDAVSGIEKFEYNVTVKKEDETVQITSDGQQQFYLLSGGETIQMNFQYHENAMNKTRGIVCFAWCNKEKVKAPPLRVTRPPRTTMAIRTIKEELLDPERPMVDVVPSKVAVSPFATYRIREGEGTTVCSDEEEKCLKEWSFHWHAEHFCYFNFICTKLNGDVCSSYGIDVAIGNNKKLQRTSHYSEYCEPNKLESGALNSSEAFSLRLWEKEGGEPYQAHCYFWCTKYGELPGKGELDVELGKKLTDGNWNTFEVTIGEGGSLSQGNQPVMSDPPKDWINISPVAHYRLVQKRGLVCQEEGASTASCTIKSVFRWHKQSTSCKGKFVCPTLEKNGCGAFGIHVSHLDDNGSVLKRKSVCLPNQPVDIILDTGFDVEIEYWYKDTSNEDVICHFWCTDESDPGLPVTLARVEDSLVDDLISSEAHLGLTTESLEPGLEVVLAPTFVYRILFKASTLTTCNETQCSEEKRFSWKRDFPCISGLLCTHLSGHVCADYSLYLKSQEICQPYRLYRESLAGEEAIALSLRYDQGAIFNAVCYVWCTKDGQLPAEPSGSTQEEEFLANLISGDIAIVEREANLGADLTLRSDDFISPVSIYSITFDSAALQFFEEPSSRSMMIAWRGEGICQLSFMCTSLSGNVCGDYAISVQKPEEEAQEICFPNEVAEISLSTGDDLEVDLWSASGEPSAAFGANCHYWCGNQIEELEPHADQVQDVDQMIFFLMSGTLEIKAFTLQGELRNHGLSHTRVYYLEASSTDLEESAISSSCVNKCRVGYTFTWKKAEPAVTRILCNVMEGNTCGSYGLTVTYGDSSTAVKTRHRLCFKNRVYQATLAKNHRAEFDLWFMRNSSFRLSCFFWATTSGALPDPKPTTVVKEDVINALIDGSRRVQSIVLHQPATVDQAIALSPAQVYQAQLSPDLYEGCGSEDHCSLMNKFTLLSRERCLMSAICLTLGPNPCGDFSLTLEYPKEENSSTIELCHSRTFYQEEVAQFREVALLLWFSESATFNIDCYFWCTEDGNMPRHFSTEEADSLSKEILNLPTRNVDFSSPGIPASRLHVYKAAVSQEDFLNITNSTNEQIMSATLSMFWYPESSAITSLFVTGLEDNNICGDFWLSLRSFSEDGLLIHDEQMICNYGEVFKVTVAEFYSVQLTVWFTQGAEFNFTAYMWTTEDGHLPHGGSAVKPVQLNTLAQLSNRTTIHVPFEIEPVAITLSMVQVYQISANSSSLECLRRKCFSTVTLAWLGQDVAQVNLVLTSLTGEGGDFGLELGNSDIIKPVDYTGKVFSIELRRGKSVTVDLWFLQDSEFSLNGYLWTGSETEPHPENLVEQDLDRVVMSLLSGNSRIEEIVFSYGAWQTTKTTTIYRAIASSDQESSHAFEECEEDLCIRRMNHKFYNHGSGPCYATFFSSVMIGNGGGDFGITLTFVNSSSSTAEVDVYFAGKFVQKPLDVGGYLEVEVWHTPEAIFGAAFFLWCTESGKEPSMENVGENIVPQEIVEALTTTPMTITSTSSSLQPVAPHMIYIINQTESFDCHSNNGDTSCSLSQNFVWYDNEPCQGRFVCTSLSDNVCGDFGISLKFGEAQEVVKVCYQSLLYPFELSGTLEVTTWTSTITEESFTAQCYLWCNPTGALPTERQTQDQIINDLLSEATAIQELQLTEVANLKESLSPLKVYHFNYHHDDNGCPDDRCVISSLLKWYGNGHNEHCQATFICSHLTCGDHGVTISIFSDDVDEVDENQSVCHSRVPHRFNMSMLDTVQMGLWFTRDSSSFETACYLWCTLDGLVPYGSHEIDSEAEVIGIVSEALVSEKNGTSQQKRLTEVNLSGRSYDPFISSEAIHQITLTPEGQICDDSDVCTITYEFFTVEGPCYATLACPAADPEAVGDTVCASYGIASDLDPEAACSPGVLHHGTITESMKVSVWFSRHAAFNQICYLWCQKDDDAEDIALVEKASDYEELVLTSANQSREIVDLRSSRVPMSTHLIYSITDEHFVNLTSMDHQSSDTTNVTMSYSEVKYLTWQGRESCHPHILCPQLSGNRCGSYGLQMLSSTNNGTVNVCKDRVALQVDPPLEPGDSLGLRLWRSSINDDENFDVAFECLLWCTVDGEVPEPKPNTTGGAEIVAKLLGFNKSPTVSLVPSSPLATVDVSPIAVYTVEVSPSDTSCGQDDDGNDDDDDQGCHLEASFLWPAWRNNSLVWKHVCSKMEGNPCADYEVTIAQTWEHESGANATEIKVCRPGEVHSGPLSPGDQVQVTIWYSNSTSIDVSEGIVCYFWATDNGSLPQIGSSGDQDGNETSHLLDDISPGIKTEELEPSMSSEALATTTIYLLDISSSSTEFTFCEEDFCWINHTLTYYRDEKCELKAECKFGPADNPACGSYGVIISEEEICYSGHLHSLATLMRGDSLTVMAWQNAGDVAYYEAKCHIWCTSEGHLPGPNEKFTGNPQEFLNELLNGTIKTRQNVSSDQEGVQPLSPFAVYGIDYVRDEGALDCDAFEDRCSVNFEFIWLRDGQATISLTCTHLNGSNCGEFGIRLVGNDYSDKNTTDMCFQGEVQSVQAMVPGTPVEVSLWHVPNAQLAVHCYLWAVVTDPAQDSGDALEVDADLLDDLLNFTALVTSQDLSQGGGNIISPVELYHFTADNNSCSGDLCRTSHELIYYGFEPCHFSLVCSELGSHHVCADHGIELTYDSNKREVCKTGHVYKEAIKSNEKVELSLWYSATAKFEASCYGWCTADGELPSQDPKSKLDTQALELLLSSKIALRTVDLNDPVENKTFSSAFSYHLLLEDKSDLPSNLSQLNFRWLGLNSCQSRFVCGKLNGNSAIKVVDDAGAKEIWVKGELYEGQMNPESTFQVHVKRTGDDMSLSCFFWCTPDGQIPEAVNGEDVADIDELVESTLPVDLVTTNELAPSTLSPVKVYHLAYNFSDSNCSELRCWTRKVLTLYASESCQLGLVCPSLPGDEACATYGIDIKLSHKDQPIAVCHEGKTVTETLYQGEGQEIGIWHSQYTDDSLSFSCYYWCTHDGLLPDNGDDKTIFKLSEDLLLDLASGQFSSVSTDLTNDHVPMGLAPNRVYQFLFDNSTTSGSASYIWYHEDSSCSVNFVCSGINGDVWGSFGISVEDSYGSRHRVFKDGAVYHTELEADDTLEVLFWISSHNVAVDPIKCFLWCGSQGALPDPVAIDPSIASAIESLVDNATDPDVLDMNSDTFMSPESIYHILIDSENLGTMCPTRKCQKNLRASWLWEQSCHAVLVCDNLSVDACEDYGLRILYPGTTKVQKICHEGAKSLGEIGFNEAATITFWYTAKAEFKLSCYFWCSDDHQELALPNKENLENIDLEFLADIASDGDVVKDVTDQSEVNLSPVTIYELNRKSEEVLECQEPVCSTQWNFRWLGDGLCHATVLCPVLGETALVCAKFGMTVSFAEQKDHRICQEGAMKDDELASGESFSIRLWYTSQSDFDVNCFVWCTDDGSLPIRHVDRQEAEDILSLVLNGTVDDQVALSVERTAPLTLSTAKLYHLTSSNVPECNVEKCSSSFSFHYYGSEPCQTRLVCPFFSENLCGDYQLSLGHEDQEIAVCQDHQVIKRVLEPDQKLQLSFWHLSKVEPVVSCFLWCTMDGSLPRLTKEPGNETFVMQLLNGVEIIHPVERPSEDDPLLLSPVVVYSIDISDADLTEEECESDICTVEYEFLWLHEESCSSVLLCSKLDGNTCGDYWVKHVDSSGETHDVCFQGASHTSKGVEFFAQPKVMIRYIEGSLFNVSCMLWCSSDEAKTPPSTHDITEEEAEAILQVINATTALEETQLASNESPANTIGSHKVYYLSLDAALESCDNETLCSLKTSLNYHGLDECSFRFICSRIEGDNICGDFGIKLKKGSDVEKLCIPRVIKGFQMDTGDSLELRVWYKNESNGKLSCQYWCTHDGAIPLASADETMDEQTLEDILTSTDLLKMSLPSSRSIHSMRRGEILAFESSAPPCSSNQTCLVEQMVECPEKCDAYFVCPTLEGDPCEHYQVQIHFEESNKTDKICERHKIMKGSIEKNFKAMVSVWYTQEVNDWRCYLWCDHKETDHQEIVECGILPPVDQKSNGVTSVPWQVQILEETPLGHEMICTGVLISQDVVLTSAHCFTQCPDRAMDEKKYGVVLGKTYLRVPGDNLLVTGIEEITIHPNFSLSGFQPPRYDLALARLSRSGEKAMPICLPEKMATMKVGDAAALSGWGSKTMEDACGYAWHDLESGEWLHTPKKIVRQNELQIVDVTVLNPANPLVQVAFPWQEEDDINIMFGKVASLSSSCQGESGSPLTTYDDRNVATLRALASFGTGTCDPEAPIGFTRVDTGDTLHWIKENSMQREIHYPSEPLLDIDFIY